MTGCEVKKPNRARLLGWQIGEENDQSPKTSRENDDYSEEDPDDSLPDRGVHRISRVGRANALVQLEAPQTMRALRAIQKCLSAATFVSQRRVPLDEATGEAR
jgi:hypothetical protein